MDYRMNSLRVDFLTVGFSWELPGELTNLNLSGFFFRTNRKGDFRCETWKIPRTKH